MTYRGRVQNGVVVVEGGPPLAEGTEVRVEVDLVASPSPRRGSAQALQAADVRWDGPPGEIERLLAEVQEMRDEDLRLELERNTGQGQGL